MKYTKEFKRKICELICNNEKTIQEISTEKNISTPSIYNCLREFKKKFNEKILNKEKYICPICQKVFHEKTPYSLKKQGNYVCSWNCMYKYTFNIGIFRENIMKLMNFSSENPVFIEFIYCHENGDML